MWINSYNAHIANYTMESVVRGHLVYKTIWQPAVISVSAISLYLDYNYPSHTQEAVAQASNTCEINPENLSA